ncbi:MAG: hypothetical protein CMG64_02955 [Candidatus Marinimicrobia bacterium]|nr:hypothetical protein [Candidatus Neomarinimicrobiota bacterium]
MYLLYNNKLIIYILLLSVVIFALQINFPVIYIYDQFYLYFDFVLIFLVVLCHRIDEHKVILLSLLFGLGQDFIINIDHIGLLSFLKCTIIFLISITNKYSFIWREIFKFFVLFLLFFIHFFFYYLIVSYSSYYSIIIISLCQSIVCYLLFYIINNFLNRLNPV